ncbi:MAG: MBL fold metallo-hydrolase [bacterium]|jgi:glyoxylase-like metal-dependent hydrolase (beta-lactamase superfamily II)
MKLTSLAVGSLLTNCYILDAGTKEALVIDPGGDVEVIVETLRKHDSELRYILATHAHFDHVGGIRQLQEALGGETLLHRADFPLLKNLAAQSAAFGLKTGPIPHIDRFVEEGDLLVLGDAHYQIVHTPGHSPGGISLIGTRMAFVGDTLFAGSIGRSDLPGGCYEDLIDSIRGKLLCLEDEASVFPGHGEATTIGQERRTNPFLLKDERA